VFSYPSCYPFTWLTYSLLTFSPTVNMLKVPYSFWFARQPAACGPRSHRGSHGVIVGICSFPALLYQNWWCCSVTIKVKLCKRAMRKWNFCNRLRNCYKNAPNILCYSTSLCLSSLSPPGKTWISDSQWLRLGLSKGPNRVGVSPHLKMEAEPVSETSCFYFLIV
jgi:hypothetical protein